MNSILITDEQDYKLTEMCKKLFPEILIYTGFGINGIRLPEHVLDTPRDLEWSTEWNLKYLVDNNGKDIHWFEFCMTYLAKKIDCDISHNVIYLEKHPVDYLYEEFKKLN